MTIPLIVVLAVMGALLGSFGCAQVWRLRAKQLIEDREEYKKIRSQGEHPNRADYYDAKELESLEGLLRPVKSDRSECLHCHHQLAWYDLIPVFSWLSLGGKCRYCRHPIGVTELAAELGLALIFTISYVAWPYDLTTILDLSIFVFWLIACLLMLILFIYDAKWSLLPFSINIILIIISTVFLVLKSIAYGFDPLSIIGAIALLSGLYAFFALFKWAGFGDSILGFGLALLLGEWQLAFIALFFANILGCVMLVPIAIKGTLKRGIKVPFGPFMVAGCFIAVLWGEQIITWFSHLTSSLFITLML